MTEEQRISAMNIETKLLMIESEIGPIVKTLQVKQEDGGYSTLSDAEILRAVKPLERKYHVKSRPGQTTTKIRMIPIGGVQAKTIVLMRVKYLFINCDDPKDFVELDTYAAGEDFGDKAFGMAMTMIRKNALKAMYKIEATDMDDPDAYPNPSSRSMRDKEVGGCIEPVDAYFESFNNINGRDIDSQQPTKDNLSDNEHPVDEVQFADFAPEDYDPVYDEGPAYNDQESSSVEDKIVEAGPKEAPEPQQEEVAVEDLWLPETLEEAENVVLKLKGRNYNKTFGEIWQTDPRNIMFFLSPGFDSKAYPVYRKAAEIISRELG